MKKFIIIILSAFIGIAHAQVKHTVTKSAVTYEIKNLGINTTGKFGGLQALINFDKAKLDSSSIEATIDVNTIDSDNAMRDNHLKGADYFNVAKYPHIIMRSTGFKHKSGNNYVGLFNLTIKDQTKPIQIPFTYTESGNVALFKGSFKVKRTDFGIGSKSLMMANEATVFITAETTR